MNKPLLSLFALYSKTEIDQDGFHLHGVGIGAIAYHPKKRWLKRELAFRLTGNGFIGSCEVEIHIGYPSGRIEMSEPKTFTFDDPFAIQQVQYVEIPVEIEGPGYYRFLLVVDGAIVAGESIQVGFDSTLELEPNADR